MRARISSIRVPTGNYIHIVHDANSAIAVDPSSAAPVMKFLESESLSLTHILVTHHHADHTGGCPELKKACGCAVIAAEDDRISCADSFDTSSLPLRVDPIHTPGHTSSHTCFYLPELISLFSGDTLFLGGCGRIFEGSPEQMWNSLLKLRRLPEDTQVYPGHDYTVDNLEFCRSVLPGNPAIEGRLAAIKSAGSPTHAPLAEESATNVFLMCDEPSFTAQTGLQGFPADIFKELRHRKDSW